MPLSKTKIKADQRSKKQITNFSQLIYHDHKIYKQYNIDSLIIGFDEVGRGCVAGPVCTGAYSCSSFYDAHPQKLLSEIKKSQEIIRALFLLDDSKKVSHAKRNLLCESLLSVPCLSGHIFHATDFHSAQEIDNNGIVQCIWSSMATNLINITLQYINFYQRYPQEIILLIDGPKKISNLTKLLENKIQSNHLKFIETINLTQVSITKGDSKSALIAAASNLAKQSRDQYMQELSNKYPDYFWHKNVGYGTTKHLEAINQNGLTNEHRKTFLRNFTTELS